MADETRLVDPPFIPNTMELVHADYYENIRDMEGAGDLRVAKSFKRKFKAIREITYASVPEIEASSSQTVDGNDSNGEDAPAEEDATGGALEGAAAGAAAPAQPRRPRRLQALTVRPRGPLPPKRRLPRGRRGAGGRG